jgi:uncharacterized membrane protein YcaP (DUF421 family)
METVVRVLVVYVLVLTGLRVMGKREFGQLSPMELISLLLIPELVGPAIVREDYSLTNGLVGVATLLLAVLAVSVASDWSGRARAALQGRPTVLVQDGRPIEEHMARERITAEEVDAALRKAGVERLEQVRWAVLEADGTISIIPAEGGVRRGEEPDERAP